MLAYGTLISIEEQDNYHINFQGIKTNTVLWFLLTLDAVQMCILKSKRACVCRF